MWRLVAIMLHLFPARFRRAFGEDMRATFEDLWRERPGWRSAARTIMDLASSAVLQHFTEPSTPARKGDPLMSALSHDFRFSIRTLAKSPGFTLVALATLGLGIGVNTAMFSVANAVLWRSLPYTDPDRVVWVGAVEQKNPDNAWGASYLNFRDWQARSHSFEAMTGIVNTTRILLQGTERTQLSGQGVTPEFFSILGVQPALGRPFSVSDDNIKDAPPVIVLSDHMWRRNFAADPALIGQTIRFEDSSFTVIGVMPNGYEHYGEVDFWVPLQEVLKTSFGRYFASHREVWVMDVMARLRKGQTVATAQTEMSAIYDQIRREHPEGDRDLRIRVTTIQRQLSRDLRPALLALLGAVGVVLLIACANLAGLMSVRASSRGREMAIRTALGAGRGSLIRQLLMECVTLAACGGIAGIVLALWATRGLQWLSTDPRLAAVPIDFRVLLFALGVTGATGLLFGVAPAIHAARTDAAEALKSGVRSGSGRGRSFARQSLVIAQIALCLVLLMGAGLLFRSFRRVLEVDPGFRTDHLSSMRIQLPNSYKTVPAIVQVFAQFIERLKSLPGVVDATLVNTLPISGGDATGDITVEGREAGPTELGTASFRRTMPGYFRGMGIPVVRGRDFSDSDDLQHERVVIINDSMARRFWPDQDAIGRRIKIGPRDSSNWETIVGVVKDVRNVGLDQDPVYATYNPVAQQPRLQMEAAIRSIGDPAMILPAAQRELKQIEPALMIDHAQTMSQRINASVARRKMNLVLFGLFSSLALVLAAVGLYGVVAYAAGQRTQEFGIRMALGARSGDVLRLVLAQGLKLAIVGGVIGIAVGLAMGRVVTKLLFEVQPTDFVTIVAVSALLGAVALLACWLPARRATRVAPTDALRAE
jgi:putative ABC transport system permease protein